LKIVLSVCQSFFKSQFTTTSMARGERKPITGVWASGGPSPGGEVWGLTPWSWLPFCFRIPKGSRKLDQLLCASRVWREHYS